jgi:hypothetical protein
MLLVKPKDTRFLRFHKRRLKSNLSFLRLSIVDQFIRLIEGSITGMKDCSWSINSSVVSAEIMICRASYNHFLTSSHNLAFHINAHKNF